MPNFDRFCSQNAQNRPLRGRDFRKKEPFLVVFFRIFSLKKTLQQAESVTFVSFQQGIPSNSETKPRNVSKRSGFCRYGITSCPLNNKTGVGEISYGLGEATPPHEQLM